MQAGVPLLRCLETSQAVVRGACLQKQLQSVHGRVRDGERFGASLAREGGLCHRCYFPLWRQGKKRGSFQRSY